MNIQWKKKTIFIYGMILFCILVSILFVQNNFYLYEQPIAKVVEATMTDEKETIDSFENKDQLFQQQLVGEIKNGEQQGQQILLENQYSLSGAADHEFQVGDIVFVTIQRNEETNLAGSIDGPKRDIYVVIAAWFFILIVLLIGRKSGLFSIISLVVNVLVLIIAMNYYTSLEDVDLWLICGGLVIFFTVFSLLLVSGNNEKTHAAIIATLAGTFSSLVIAYAVIALTAGEGLRYEEMAFITRNPQSIFLASLLVGSLGAAMDIAITITSSLYELNDKNNAISLKDLKTSGREIGKDIMGTMANVLFFAYVSGSIPMILLYLKNGMAVNYTLTMNLSLELTRALVGSIGIVMTIPISIYTATYFIRKRRAVK
ncbi:YibE/F family protein [Desemzia sp. RIT 804]|uniref:YibE/F family protein n=1 Tax=Desemzia sp. RIT 804 TaxID=2810209 RepID=UPI001F15AAA5|nr:YibE/F family protein [Desemzia sp. RIT 804]